MLKWIAAAAAALLLTASQAGAQSNPGTSPLSGPKGGTNNAFMQFAGPAGSLKTFTLPNASDTIATLGAIQTITAAKTFASATLLLAGSSSGAGTLNAPAAASSYVWTLPAATDTLVGRATTDTLTNKTFDTAGAGNSFSINGLAATANTGTGAVVRATSPSIASPSLTTPTLGVATATTINKVTITAPAAGATLTIPDGVTLTGPASSGTAMTLGNTETVTGAKTFGSAGAVGRLRLAGTTSGSTILDASATASGTLTLPAATDVLMGRATTDTMTNKTFDTAGTGNSLSINGLAATANTGTGSVVRATSPTLTTPALGVATATSINKVAITAPATAATLTIPDGVTLTGPAASGTAMTLGNAETVTGAKSFNDSTVLLKGSSSGAGTLKAPAAASSYVWTLPAATDTLVGKSTTDTLTNKTFDTAGAGNSFSINGLAATANTGTGAVVRATSPTLVTPSLGTPSALTLTNATGLPIGGLSGLGTGVATALGNSTNGAGGLVGFSGALGTPTSGTLTNATGLPIAGIAGLGTGVGTWLAAPSSANLATALTDETGSGAAVFGTAPTISAPVITGAADVQQSVALTGDISPTQLSADTNDWAPTGFATASTVRLSTDASRNITGMAGGSDGRVIILHNVGLQNAVLTNEAAASTAGNRFLFGGDVTLSANTSIALRYDATSSRWRAITSPGSGGGGGGGSVTSVTVAAGAGLAVAGTVPITTSGTVTLAYAGPTDSGQLQYSSSSSIKFMPFKGELIRIAGVAYAIPSAGVDSGNPNGGVLLNGTGSSSLTAGTLYYAYIYDDAGTLRMDFSTTGYVVDSTAGNVGTAVKSGDPSRSLIGMVRTASGPIFVSSSRQKFVRSWFNDDGVDAFGVFTSDRTTTSGSIVELNTEIRTEVLLWANERLIYSLFGSASVSTAGGTALYCGVGYDSTSADYTYITTPSGNFYRNPVAITQPKFGAAEGHHWVTLLGATSAGTATFFSAANDGGFRLVVQTRRN